MHRWEHRCAEPSPRENNPRALCIVVALQVIHTIQIPEVIQFGSIHNRQYPTGTASATSCETHGNVDTTHTGRAGETHAVNRLRRATLWRPVYPRSARSTGYQPYTVTSARSTGYQPYDLTVHEHRISVVTITTGIMDQISTSDLSLRSLVPSGIDAAAVPAGGASSSSWTMAVPMEGLVPGPRPPEGVLSTFRGIPMANAVPRSEPQQMVAYQNPPMTWGQPIPSSPEQVMLHEIQQLRSHVSTYEQREGFFAAQFEARLNELAQSARQMETELKAQLQQRDSHLQHVSQQEATARWMAEKHGRDLEQMRVGEAHATVAVGRFHNEVASQNKRTFEQSQNLHQEYRRECEALEHVQRRAQEQYDCFHNSARAVQEEFMTAKANFIQIHARDQHNQCQLAHLEAKIQSSGNYSEEQFQKLEEMALEVVTDLRSELRDASSSAQEQHHQLETMCFERSSTPRS